MVEVINSYETVMVLNPNFEEEKLEALIEKFQSLISSNGEVVKTDVWGKRKLAYEIADLTEGYYVLIEFKSKPDFPAELERIYKITDGVIRDIVVKQEEK